MLPQAVHTINVKSQEKKSINTRKFINAYFTICLTGFSIMLDKIIYFEA